ncbi:MAG: hypothetical protein APF84_06740 [Gracilibacter sp. BRH_c7a]|nr:MAG: hypothetical protein APF84_06740 [Gracilibacter sp. BRH_c7a]
MLMRIAELQSDANFGKSSILSVWVSFEESIRIERIKVIDSTVDPFLQWTMGKILIEVLSKIIDLKPTCVDELSARLANIFGNAVDVSTSQKKYQHYTKILSEYIQVLEKGDIGDSKILSKIAPSPDLTKILDNPTSFKKFLIELIKDFELERVILLFDEAAHVFSYTQQEKFFTFFKTLRHPRIACKAAVYPGITNYGKYFEKGQDAKELRLTWDFNNTQDIKYIKDILKKRIQSFDLEYWNKLTINTAIIDAICVCSNGNPRLAFHIVDNLENEKVFKQKNISLQQVINSVRSVIENKWREFSTLKNRLAKYKTSIEVAEDLMKYTIIPKTREWNNKQRTTAKSLSAGFYLSTNVYDNISQVFDVLAYSSFVSIDYSKKSVGKGLYGYYVSINPSILFADLILRELGEIKLVSKNIRATQGYYTTTTEIKQLIDNLKIENEYRCSNTNCNYTTNDETFTYCPKCANKMELTEPESLYKILRSHDIENLKFSNKLTNRLKDKFSNIGEIYDADIDVIRMKYIQDVRVEKIKNAAIEYMAG